MQRMQRIGLMQRIGVVMQGIGMGVWKIWVERRGMRGLWETAVRIRGVGAEYGESE